MWKAAIAAIPLIAIALLSRHTRIDWTHPISDIASEICGHEEPFLSENQAAMHRMMKDMNIVPSGDVDRDFSAMMIPHHQGAIEMAQAELRHGQNEQLRRIAQEIIVEQQQEIAAMRLALGQPPRPSTTPVEAAGQSRTAANSALQSSLANTAHQ